MQDTYELIILGSGIAALSAAEACNKQNPDLAIHIFTQDNQLPYYRLRLCECLSEPEKSLCIHPAQWYADRKINFHFQKQAVKLLADEKVLYFTDGTQICYNKLIIATGSHAFVPPIEGMKGDKIFSLWTREDALALRAQIDPLARVVVLGGGLLGLEAAYEVIQAGAKEVTILEFAPVLLGRQTDAQSSALFRAKVESLGIRVMTQASVNKITDQDGGKLLTLADGREILCDCVVVSTGVRANTEWLAESGLHMEKGHIIVNDAMETNLPDIYAAGDAATQNTLWFGLWSVSMGQGKAAGINAGGGQACYALSVPPYVINTMGTSLASAGIYPNEKQAYETLETDPDSYTYSRIIYATEDPTGPVLGYVLLGNIKSFQNLQKRLIVQ